MKCFYISTQYAMPVGEGDAIKSNGAYFILPKKCVKQEILDLQRRAVNNNDNSSSPRVKEQQTIWQKATTLRQSLRHKTKGKSESSSHLPNEKSASSKPLLQREWGSQRNLARERRSLVAKILSREELAASKRSLHSRSLCMSSDWTVDDEPLTIKQPRSPRKLTKDSGYETSAQCDPDYANSLSDWISEETPSGAKSRPILPDKPDINRKDNTRASRNKEERSEWNSRHRPLSFSHQEVTSECVKNIRQLRHSYSQREVSRHSDNTSIESLASSSTDLKKSYNSTVESASAWSGSNPVVAKSAAHLERNRHQSVSSGSLLQSDVDEAGVNSMVTRRFKKGSVYDTLASTSGLDFSPVVQLKTYSTRRDESSPQIQPPKPPDKAREKSPKLLHDDKSSLKNLNDTKLSDKAKLENPNMPLNSNNPLNSSENKDESLVPKAEVNENAKCIAAHEKYPSWPVTGSETSSVSYRSHSWTGQTDYPKEKVSYSRPKKANQYKISTNQLQPVLERATDYSNSNKTFSESPGSPNRKKCSENYNVPYSTCGNTSRDSDDKQFDFEAFHTPCIPQCYEGKDYGIHSPPERDGSSSTTSSNSKVQHSPAAIDSSEFLSKYENVHHEAQYSAPLPTACYKQRTIENKNEPVAPDTPFLDRLRMENAWQLPPPPVPIHHEAVPELQQHQQGNDFELSSENGTWMGSMESSSHGRGIPKWQGSYSDLSTLSTQLSNRSSLFDSGHSTMPESGRLSPQSSCDSTAPSLMLEGPTRAQVVARHGCHREIVAHSARVQQPERHGSESVLYYANNSSSRPKTFDNDCSSVSMEQIAGVNNMTAEEALFCSRASLTLSSPLSESSECRSKATNYPKRQDSENSSKSFNSEESFPYYSTSDNTSGSSSDVSNITCISNYKGSPKPHAKSLEKSSSGRDCIPKNLDHSYSKYKTGSKSMDETSRDRKSVFPEADKRHRASDPELKAIQKQAVMSFYQRMSLAESIKSDSKFPLHSSTDTEPPPPYEASQSSKMRGLFNSTPKFSLLPNKIPKQYIPKCPTQISPQTSKASDSGLSSYYSKSVPNLILKGQSLDLPPSHPFFKQTYNGNLRGERSNHHNLLQKKRGSPLAKEEIISWDQLPNVLEKKREASEKATSPSDDPSEVNGGCTSGMQHYLKSSRKVQLKEVHHSNETASVKVMTPEGVTLVQANEKKHKRRPAPPPPPKQPPRRPPPPPPPVTPPLTQVIVEGNDLDIKTDVKTTPGHPILPSQHIKHMSYSEGDVPCPSSPDLPLPPPPSTEENEVVCDDPLPPPPDPKDVEVQPRILDDTMLIYPKNSYMSYRSGKKFARQGFDGKYQRSFHSSASSVDLTTIDSSFEDGRSGFSVNKWEQMHDICQHGTTVIFHSDCLQQNGLLKSSSQDCILIEESSQNESDKVSNCDFQDSEKRQSSSSIIQSSQTKETLHRAVPYQEPSQDGMNLDVKVSTSDSFQNVPTTKAVTPNCSGDAVITSANNDHSFQNNESATDYSVQNPEESSDVDYNQNTLKNNQSGKSLSKPLNGNDLINRINSATQKTARLRLIKTQEELECEELSRDFIHHYGDIELKNLLVPSANHKTLSDYLEGLLNIEFEKGYQHNNQKTAKQNGRTENQLNDEKISNEKNPQESTAEIPSSEDNDNRNVDNETLLKKRKEKLMESIGKKLESLRGEQSNIRTEMLHNENLGQEIISRLQELAKPNEIEKYTLHVEELEKIINLLLSLSGRLARAENILKNMPKDCSEEEKKILETKRNKLQEQHEDACRLKESIDKRSNQVSTFLHKYFSDEEYAKYDHFIKMKTKFLIDIREIDEKINLGDEQLTALRVVAHLWKSANS